MIVENNHGIIKIFFKIKLSYINNAELDHGIENHIWLNAQGKMIHAAGLLQVTLTFATLCVYNTQNPFIYWFQNR